MLENAVCPFKMYRHDDLRLAPKKEGFGDFLEG